MCIRDRYRTQYNTDTYIHIQWKPLTLIKRTYRICIENVRTIYRLLCIENSLYTIFSWYKWKSQNAKGDTVYSMCDVLCLLWRSITVWPARTVSVFFDTAIKRNNFVTNDWMTFLKSQFILRINVENLKIKCTTPDTVVQYCVNYTWQCSLKPIFKMYVAVKKYFYVELKTNKNAYVILAMRWLFQSFGDYSARQSCVRSRSVVPLSLIHI